MYQALSQLDLAERSGVSRPTVTRAEAGEHISFANIRKLVAALGISVHELLREEPGKVKTE